MQDQLNLWQAETQRVQTLEVTYYSKFEDEDLFQATLNCASGHGTVLFFKHEKQNPEASFLVIRRSGKGLMTDSAVACNLPGTTAGVNHAAHMKRGTEVLLPASYSSVSQGQ